MFILICFGMTQIIVSGSIFDEIRPTEGLLGKLFHCSMCMGFHVGWIVYILSFLTEAFNLGNFNLIMMFFYACLSSATSYLMCILVDDDGFRISKK